MDMNTITKTVQQYSSVSLCLLLSLYEYIQSFLSVTYFFVFGLIEAKTTNWSDALLNDFTKLNMNIKKSNEDQVSTFMLSCVYDIIIDDVFWWMVSSQNTFW